MTRPRPSAVVQRHRQAIRDIVQRHNGLNPRIFGSVARGEDTEASDLDLLVEVGALLALPVQVVTPACLPPKVRAAVEHEAVPL